MILALTFAAMSGILVGLNRQINGRLGLSTSPMFASFTNHLVGFVLLSLAGAAIGGLLSGDALNSPWYAYLGGPIGVIFVATSSWLIPRIGAVQTTMLMISGQMLSGVALDIARDAPGSLWARLLGVALIMTGILMTRKRAR
ncbi:membrane protein [Devosia geojensis]|uniref:Membrane protein n=1 Tax=Devosia geojensis TaxID=443610 RepID=A0A0F5FVF9_9HYPH|nr:DMT family transporter [Devosia geojensis]KKB12157.1 membrane protein [Devosia geojensis]